METKREYSPNTLKILKALKEIPHGKVDTYGRVADRAGLIRGARQVAWVLSSLSERENLPWHRVVNQRGSIALSGEGGQVQARLLEAEGVLIHAGRVDLRIYLFQSEDMRIEDEVYDE